MMNGERWQKVSSIFHDALQCEADVREEFLQSACGADESLRRQIESLLGSYEQAGSCFDRTALERTARAFVQDESDSLINELVGQYRIRRLLGAGGMGEVYLADDARLNRQVAIKLLPLHLAADEEQVRRFQLEARAASALNHPNILTIHETGEHFNRHYIVMEFVAGATLREMLATERLTLAERVDVALQVCDALSAAHAAGIVHRDIKPENVMLRPDGYAKVLDFGLAKLAATNTIQDGAETDNVANANPVETAAGVLLGTVRYMSPEQVRGLSVDERTDIWSLGVVLYEMFESRAPFAGATTADTIAHILEREPGLFVEETPLPLQRCVLKALNKNREERFTSARAFADELRKIKREMGATDTFGWNDTTDKLSANDRNALHLSDQIKNAPTALLREREIDSTHTKGTPTNPLAPAHETVNVTLFQSRVIRRWKAVVAVAGAAVLLFAFVSLVVRTGRQDETRASVSAPTSSLNAAQTDVKANAPTRSYRDMNNEERLSFVSEQALRVSQALGEGATALSLDAVQTIKRHVDAYDRRRDKSSQEPYKENLNEIYTRAALYAPLLSFHFKKQNVPPITGIYIPMIESEYHDCLTSPMGAQGKFQFMEQTARNYGVRPEDRCNVDVIAPVAARYIKDRTKEFGADAASMTLVIASFNRGSRLIKSDLEKLNRFAIGNNTKPDFWFLLAHADELDEQFRGENRHYVPRFFAAAIIGENPQAFKLSTPPLSTLDNSNRAR